MLQENFPKLLDRILSAFLDNYNSPKSLDELKSTVFIDILGKDYSLENLDKNLEIACKEIFDYTDYIKYGLNFLQEEGLIIYDSSKMDNEKSVRITSKGFFKIKTESFSDKIESDKQIKNLQKDTFIVSIEASKIAKKTFNVAIFSLMISVIAVVVTAYYSTTTNEISCCNNSCKTAEIPNHSQSLKSPHVFQTPNKANLKE